MIIFVNKEINQRISIEEITFVVGRGSVLQVNDKKVSRNHGVINVLDPDGVISIKSTHPNPIFYKQQDSIEQLKVLHKDQDVTLSTGDSFGLLENELWYEIATDNDTRTEETGQAAGQGVDFDDATQIYTAPLVKEEEIEPQAVTEDTPPVTGDASAASVAVPPAIVEVPPATVHAPPASVPARRIPAWMVTQSEAESSTKRLVDDTAEEETPKRIKVEDTSGPSTSGVNNIPAATSTPVVVKTEPPDTNPKVASADSSTRRPTCNFGVRCYRKHNPIHAAAEAHPGDRDYRRPDFPPAPTDAPPCPYGASCYRRNPRHFMEFSHPDASIYFPANLQQQILNNKRRRTVVNYTVRVNIGEDISDDDDDEEDFQASDDEDVYDPNKTESEDSDEEESQPVASEEL